MKKQVNKKIYVLQIILLVTFLFFSCIYINNYEKNTILSQTVNVTESNRLYLTPCGTPFGMKMLSDGVIVTGFGQIHDIENPFAGSPAVRAGLKKGDIITHINGIKITSTKTLTEEIQKVKKDMKIEIIRNDKKMTFEVTPEKDENGDNKIGVWVRDSTAGIGTMTFYDEKTKCFAGLGHGVCDTDTATLIPLYKGEITSAIITNVKKGMPGNPGELSGILVTDRIIGHMTANTNSGIFILPINKVCVNTKKMPVAFGNEIKTGKAYILSTTNGTTPEKYEIEIEKIMRDDDENKNLIIKIIDKKLIEKTGGIVQGMSGSPIIQDEMIIGAVTHVFINDPTHGYAITTENMYKSFKSFYDNTEAFT